MATTAKGVANGLATLDSSGKLKTTQLPGDLGDFATGDAVADVASADADSTYDADTATLINECKDQLNALLAELRTSGVIASS